MFNSGAEVFLLCLFQQHPVFTQMWTSYARFLASANNVLCHILALVKLLHVAQHTTHTHTQTSIKYLSYDGRPVCRCLCDRLFFHIRGCNSLSQRSFFPFACITHSSLPVGDVQSRRCVRAGERNRWYCHLPQLVWCFTTELLSSFANI